MESKTKLKGNQCTACKKTHEQCADEKSCTKSSVSLRVCVIFGTRRPR